MNKFPPRRAGSKRPGPKCEERGGRTCRLDEPAAETLLLGGELCGRRCQWSCARFPRQPASAENSLMFLARDSPSA